MTYPRSKKDVKLGNKLKPKAVHHSPDLYVEIIPTKTLAPERTYILAMTDPDATSRAEPVKSEMCHWIVANLTFNAEDAQSPVEIMSYYPPAPPPKTDYHRYVFVLLSGSSDNLQKPKERPHWGYEKIKVGVRRWAKDNNLEVIGRLPRVAGNLMFMTLIARIQEPISSFLKTKNNRIFLRTRMQA